MLRQIASWISQRPAIVHGFLRYAQFENSFALATGCDGQKWRFHAAFFLACDGSLSQVEFALDSAAALIRNPVPAYQTPSKFAKDVVRSLANPNFEPRTSQSRTPHPFAT